MSIIVEVNEFIINVPFDQIDSIKDIDILNALNSTGIIDPMEYPVAYDRLRNQIVGLDTSDEESDEDVMVDPERVAFARCEDDKDVNENLHTVCKNLATQMKLTIEYNSKEVKLVFMSDTEDININITNVLKTLGMRRRFGNEIIRSHHATDNELFYYKLRFHNCYTESKRRFMQVTGAMYFDVETTIVLQIEPFFPSLQFTSYLQIVNLLYTKSETCVFTDDQIKSLNHLKLISHTTDFNNALKYRRVNLKTITPPTIY
jgi:hypothetical protein